MVGKLEPETEGMRLWREKMPSVSKFLQKISVLTHIEFVQVSNYNERNLEDGKLTLFPIKDNSDLSEFMNMPLVDRPKHLFNSWDIISFLHR